MMRGKGRRTDNTTWVPVIWAIAVVCWSTAAVGISLSGLHAGYRPAVMFGFLVLCPGISLLGLANWVEPAQRIVFGIAIGLALEVLLGQVMVATHHWSITFAVICVAILSCLTAVASAAGVGCNGTIARSPLEGNHSGSR